jgi:hypothetical protein
MSQTIKNITKIIKTMGIWWCSDQRCLLGTFSKHRTNGASITSLSVMCIYIYIYVRVCVWFLMGKNRSNSIKMKVFMGKTSNYIRDSPWFSKRPSDWSAPDWSRHSALPFLWRWPLINWYRLHTPDVLCLCCFSFKQINNNMKCVSKSGASKNIGFPIKSTCLRVK